jgi:hypothetical protein
MSNFATAADALRIDRNRLLAATDYVMIADWPITEEKRNELKAYRQALRDLPITSTPTFNDNMQVVGVVWPTKPS